MNHQKVFVQSSSQAFYINYEYNGDYVASYLPQILSVKHDGISFK